MRCLDRKLLRDLWSMKGQALAIAFVVGAGLATFVLSLSTLESLQHTRARFYDRYRFADVFASVKRAPQQIRERVAAIPGVAEVETRVVVDVTLDLVGMSEPAKGHVVSLPPSGRPQLNQVHLRRGRMPDATRENEILISEAFADAHRYGPGTEITAIINGRHRVLHVVGVALAPEFIYVIPPGDVFPDDLRYALIWMGEEGLAAAFDMKGGCNDIALRLTPTASVDAVIDQLDPLLRPYGGIGAIPRAQQFSHWYLEGEFEQLRGMGTMMPIIFLGVAAFLLNMVLMRLIGTQREQIALIKSFGYGNREIGAHFLKFALVIVSVGTVLGLIFGAWLGHGMAQMYAMFFRFPELEFFVSLRVIVWSCVVGFAAGGVGAWSAVRRATSLPPAEAMRPEAPENYKPTLVERMGLQRFMSQPVRMVVRYVERRPLKTFAASLGIGLSVAILIVGTFMIDAIDYVMDVQFNIAQREHMMVTFAEPTSSRALTELHQLPGVRQVEPLRAVAVDMWHEQRHRRVGIQGLLPSPDLHRVINRELEAVTLPAEGLVINRKLAEILAVGIGDAIRLEVLEGSQPVREARVTALIDDHFGLSAFMHIDALHRLLREDDAVSGAFLTIDSDQSEALFRAVKDRPRVAGVTLTLAAYESFKDTLAENLLRMTSVNVIFACIIAFGVVYNSARIALAERSRELATMRVLGLTRAEISGILLGELAVVTAIAIPLGWWLGGALAGGLIAGLDTEVYRIPLIIEPRTYLFATVVVVVAACFSGLVVRRRVDHLDLLAVLKTRE
ncbi:MAG: FtsX-like permease family protein [Planctomycetota bacterium]